MMRNAQLFTLAALITISAGCSSKGDSDGESSGNNTSVPATVPEGVNESLVQDPQNHAVPLDPPPAPKR